MLERVIAAAVDITPAEKGNIQLRDDDNVLTIELIRTLRETMARRRCWCWCVDGRGLATGAIAEQLGGSIMNGVPRRPRTGMTPDPRPDSVIDEGLLQRAYSEFLEMPGLRLTCQQAQRLWGLDQRTCHELLECLVDAGFLRRHERGTYMRLTDGHAPRPRMIAARIADDPPRVKKTAV